MYFLPENLKYLRQKAGLTQLELAEKLGYSSDAAVSQWERGFCDPNFKAVRTMAEIFNTDINALCYENLESRDNIDEMRCTFGNLMEDERYMVENYRKLNQVGKKKLQDYSELLMKDETNTKNSIQDSQEVG